MYIKSIEMKNKSNQHHKIPEAFRIMINKDITLSLALTKSFKGNMRKTIKIISINSIVKNLNSKGMTKENILKIRTIHKINKLILKTVKVKDL